MAVVVVVAPAALVVAVGELGAESSMPSGTTGECGATLLLLLAAEEALLRFRLLRLRGLAICLDSSLSSSSSSSSASSAPREGARLRDRFLAGDAADIAWALLLLRFLLLVLALVLPRALALALAEEAMPGGLGASVLTTVAVLLLLLFFFFFLRAFFCFFPSLLPLPFELAGAAAAAAAAAAVFVAGAALRAEVGD